MNNTSHKIALVRSVIVILISTVGVLACTWYLMTDRSVRFNGYRTGRGFYRLPPLPIMYDKEAGKELSVADLGESNEDEDWESGSSEGSPVDPSDGVWTEAISALGEKDLSRARDVLQSFLKQTELTTDIWDDPSKTRSRRNAARDMLDALSALREGSRQQAVVDYSKARLALMEGTELTDPPPSDDKNLRDNWDYLRAAKLYASKDTQGAREAFKEHVRKYPNSEKNEAAMFMLAKIAMESSHSFQNAACGAQGKGEWGKPIDPSKVEAPEKCRDDYWQSAIDAFKQLMRKYPAGQYFDDSRGWLAYLYRRGNDRAEALAEYYRMLGHPTNLAVRIEAKKSLQILGHEYDDATLEQVEKLIKDESDAAMAYAYHRIYNYATDLTYIKRDAWYCWREYSEQELDQEKCVREANKAGNHELERVARFATSSVRHYPRASVSGGFVLRVAEAQLELRNFKESLELAKKALALGVQRELRTEALWVKGSTEHELGDLNAARKTFEQLVSEFPKSKHNGPARRLLALIAEDRGDLESALDYYISLHYEYDVAYYVDAFLPTDRLAKYVTSRPNNELHDELLYSLGVRYMRERRWSEARATLLRVRTTPGRERYDYYDYEKKRNLAYTKEPDWEERTARVIHTEWVMLDLKTIDTLENMEKAVADAPDDESKAEAMYQMASYFFAADDLLLYNAAVWKGMRADLLQRLTFEEGIRFPEETQNIFNHSQEHDTYARAIPIYLEIVDLYPKTRAAKDALYSAAVAHEKLSSINNYWRDAYERNLFAGYRYVTYDDVRSKYPKYQLPRGTNGWQPATRTVNGGPGWAPPVKPAPRETKEHKIKRLLREATTTVSDYANKILPKVENKVDAQIDWYKSAIEAAVYGTFSGIGLSVLIFIGIGLHLRKSPPQAITKLDENKTADSRVDKFLA